MRVRHSSHSVHLEVLVRTVGGDILDRAPVCETWLGIVEILIAKVLHVVGVDVGDTLGDLRSRHTPV